MEKRLELFCKHVAKNYPIRNGKIALVGLQQLQLYVTLDQMERDNVIDGFPTALAYRIYEGYCIRYGYEPVNKLHFANVLHRWFDYVTIVKRKKNRIFRTLCKCSVQICSRTD